MRFPVVATALVALALQSTAAAAQSAAPELPPAPELLAPEGWLGIHYVCEIETWTKNREFFVKHNGYPLVAAVEPGSPADRAGIEAGDTIIAYNNDDINGRVLSLTKLLKPGSKLNVRIHRANESYDIPVIVARRTMYAPDVGVIAPNVLVEIDSVTGLAQRVMIRRRSPRAAPMVVMVDPSTRTPALALLPPLPPAPIAWSTTTALAGAELARVTPELGESFGVARGVLVLSVGANTPAARAGLRGGDVITRVDGNEVSSASQIQRAMQRGGRGIELTVIRKRKQIGIGLRW